MIYFKINLLVLFYFDQRPTNLGPTLLRLAYYNSVMIKVRHYNQNLYRFWQTIYKVLATTEVYRVYGITLKVFWWHKSLSLKSFLLLQKQYIKRLLSDQCNWHTTILSDFSSFHPQVDPNRVLIVILIYHIANYSYAIRIHKCLIQRMLCVEKMVWCLKAVTIR